MTLMCVPPATHHRVVVMAAGVACPTALLTVAGGTQLNTSTLPASVVAVNVTNAATQASTIEWYVVSPCAATAACAGAAPSPSYVAAVPNSGGPQPPAGPPYACTATWPQMTSAPTYSPSAESVSWAYLDAGQTVPLTLTMVCDRSVDAAHYSGQGGLRLASGSLQLGIGCSAVCGPASDDDGYSWSAAFILLVFLSAFVYLVGGCAYNLAQGKKGADIIPNIAFWREFPGLVLDGIKYASSCGGSCWSSAASRGASYVPL